MSIFSALNKSVTGVEPTSGRVAHLIRVVIDSYGVEGLSQGFIFIFKSGMTFFTNTDKVPKNLDYSGGYHSIPMAKIVEFCKGLKFPDGKLIYFNADDLTYATFLWLRQEYGFYYVVENLFNSFGNWAVEWRASDLIVTSNVKGDKKLCNMNLIDESILIFSSDGAIEAANRARNFPKLMGNGSCQHWETR